jgi:hypothetical protein
MNEIIIYQASNDQTQVEVKFEYETVWLTQKQMAQLFAKSLKTINEHIRNTYKGHELEKNSTIRNFRIVQKEGKRTIEREVEHYNLDVIISIGYRVKSKQGTQFRQWSTRETDPKPDVQISWIKVNSNKEILPTLPCWQK